MVSDRARAAQRAEQAGRAGLGAEVLAEHAVALPVPSCSTEVRRGSVSGAHACQAAIAVAADGSEARNCAARADAVHAHLEAGDDAEVAAAPAAQRPEQVLVVARVDAAQPPVGRDDDEPGDAVGRQPQARAARP